MKTSSQSGNILFYILIAVALLAALSFAVTQSNRGSASQVNEEKAKLLASEIIEYANAVASATAQLRLRGIKDTDLCFDDTQWGGAPYNNPSCTDDMTKIFGLKGGGVTWKQAPPEAMDQAVTPDNLWHIYGDNEIQNVGTTCAAASCADLILVTDELKQEICIKLNEMLSVSNPGGIPPTDTDMGTTRFIGTFGYDATIGDDPGGEPLAGRTAGCFQKTGGTAKYTFYKVLIAR